MSIDGPHAYRANQSFGIGEVMIIAVTVFLTGFFKSINTNFDIVVYVV